MMMSHPYNLTDVVGPSSPPPRGAQRTHLGGGAKTAVRMNAGRCVRVAHDVVVGAAVTCSGAAVTPHPIEPVKPPSLTRKQLVHCTQAANHVDPMPLADLLLPTAWQLLVGDGTADNAYRRRHNAVDTGTVSSVPSNPVRVATLYDGPDVPLVFDTNPHSHQQQHQQQQQLGVAASSCRRRVPLMRQAAPLPNRRQHARLPTPQAVRGETTMPTLHPKTKSYVSLLALNTTTKALMIETKPDDGTLRPWTPAGGSSDAEQSPCAALRVSPTPRTPSVPPSDDSPTAVRAATDSDTAPTQRASRLRLQCVSLLAQQHHTALEARYFGMWLRHSKGNPQRATTPSLGARTTQESSAQRSERPLLHATADAMGQVAARHLRLRYFLNWQQQQKYVRWARGASLTRDRPRRTPSDSASPPRVLGATPPPGRYALDASSVLFTPGSQLSVLCDDEVQLFTPGSPPPSCRRTVVRSPPPLMPPLTGEVATCDGEVDGRTVHLRDADIEAAAASLQGCCDVSDLVASPRRDAHVSEAAVGYGVGVDCDAHSSVPVTRIKFFHGSL